MEKKTIGAFIAALRKANGLTQKQLAEKLNVSDKAVSRWERDETLPDLSLIPVIADIFGVTSDEILRGHRKNTDTPETEYEAQQTEKQIRHLLEQAKTNYRIRSIISAAIALMGLIAAMICNIGFLRANIGFFVGSIFYVASAVCQIIFMILAFSSAHYEDIHADKKDDFQKEIIQIAMLVLSLIVVLLAATLPLLTLIDDAYFGLSGYDWLFYGAAYAIVGLLIAGAVNLGINIHLGYQKLPDMTKPRNKLRGRSAGILILVLAVTLTTQVFTQEFLSNNMQLLNPGTRWDSWDELKEFLETPMTPDGEEMTPVSSNQYIGPDGTIYYTPQNPVVLVYESDMNTPKYEYMQNNLTVRRFFFSSTEDHLPIYTYDSQQFAAAVNKLESITIIFCALYIIEILTAIFIYRRKSKKLANP